MTSIILDASAFLAFVQKEKGYEQVQTFLQKSGCYISVVNMAEVCTKFVLHCFF